MKQFALAALLGVVSSIKFSDFNSLNESEFVVLWSQAGQPIATVWNDKNPHPGYPAGHDDFFGKEGLGTYDRAIPTNFEGPGSGDDQFMNSMINNYAVEESKPDGTPTGKFVLKKNDAYQAAIEVTRTHMGLNGEAQKKYLDENFDKTWTHFNTADDGKIEAERMSGFFRFLCGNMQINLH